MGSYHCRVCDLGQPEPPWGTDGISPNYTFCDCCGVKFGYLDCELSEVRDRRADWLDSGAKWSQPSACPVNWSVEQQLAEIPPEFQ